MQTFFYVCFGLGLGYAVLNFLLGEIFSGIDFDTDFDLDGFLPLKPALIALFLAVFGGVGLLLYKNNPIAFTVSVASVIAFFVSFCVQKFVIVPLYKAQSTSAVEIQSLIGKTATVTVAIPQGKYGKITYSAAGNTYSAPAKSEDGSEINKSERVEIIHIEKNTYYVKKVG